MKKNNYIFSRFMSDFFACYWETLFQSYLGDDVMVGDAADRHMEYALKKTEKVFLGNNINIKVEPKTKKWLFDNTKIMYYLKPRDEKQESHILSKFKEVFDYDTPKPDAESQREYQELYDGFRASISR